MGVEILEEPFGFVSRPARNDHLDFPSEGDKLMFSIRNLRRWGHFGGPSMGVRLIHDVSRRIYRLGGELRRDDQTAVDALHAFGIDIPVSCEQGLCGTCVVGCEGEGAEHRDFCLTRSERAHKVALCCSRAKGDELVISL